MKPRFLPALLTMIILLAGALRLNAQAQSQQYDAYFSLNIVGQDYRDAGEREKALKDSLAASSYDANHDGKLDAREFAAWQKHIRSFVAQQPKLMKRFDRNHDGVLDDTEWDAAYADIFETEIASTGTRK